MEIFDKLKFIAKTLREADKIEQYQQILDVQEKLLEMQNKIADIETDNKRLKDEFEIKEDLIPDGNVYWILKDGKKDGPFCTCCWDFEHKLMRLHKTPRCNSFNCPKCKTAVYEDGPQIYRPINHIKDSAE